jgi:hypothetical protein
VDSALFSLYFVYKTDIDVASEFDNAPSTSPYSTLAKVFQMVEKEGWDTARLFWSMHFNILKQTDQKPISMFGSLDERVFCFIKNEQRHSNEVTCSRVDCTERQRNFTTTELTLL